MLNSTVTSAAALVAAVLTAITLMFVWSGTEQVSVEWRSMANDYPQGELLALLYPEDDDTYSSSSASSSMDEPKQPTRNGERYVLWLNISGFRGDYVESANAPYFEGLRDKGYYTSDLIPAFPSLEYPTMLAQATGVPVSGHGISTNVIRHPETKEIVDRPTDLSLLKAEPIWTTAKKQGVRVLVHDWPFSQQQPAENAADIHLTSFDPALSDEDRLNRLFDAWLSDENETKLRLVMGSLYGIDKAARDYGSREADTYEAVRKMDGILKTFLEKVESNWDKLSKPGDRLFVVLTTDHGMRDADKLINFSELMGTLTDYVDFATHDAVAHIWFKDENPTQQLVEKLDEELGNVIYWRSFNQGEYPDMWRMGSGGPLFGDRLIILKSGYGFTDKSGSESVFAPAETSGPFAVSGFHVQDQTRMKGQAFIFEMSGGYGSDLGDVDCTQLHATVANLLGIKPAEGVQGEALNINW